MGDVEEKVSNGANGHHTEEEADARLAKRPRLLEANQVKNKATVILGAQWGDEGKGKVVDMLAGDADIVARCQVQNCFKNATFIDAKCWEYHCRISQNEQYPCANIYFNLFCQYDKIFQYLVKAS